MSIENLPTNVYSLRQSEFKAIPGTPWAYWVSDNIRHIFLTDKPFSYISKRPNPGNSSDNFRFLRMRWEIPESDFGPEKKWIIYSKGGGFKKWYGNLDNVINWSQKAREFYKYDFIARITNEEYWYKEAVTYSSISSRNFSARYLPPLGVYDRGGPAIVVNDPSFMPIALGLLNSHLISWILNLLNPSINIQGGDIDRLPFPSINVQNSEQLSKLTIECIYLAQNAYLTKDDSSYGYIGPLNWHYGCNDAIRINDQLSSLEKEINQEVYKLFGISLEESSLIESEISDNVTHADNLESFDDDISLNNDFNGEEISFSTKDLGITYISYSGGIVLNRFHPGTAGALGSAIYRRSDFAIGSLPEPSEEEFNELVGEPSQFAYIDEQGGRHVFSREVEQALQKLAISDGIAVFDPNHPRDLPTLVGKALELMLGQAQAQEVIQQAAGGDLRKFLEKDFFTQHHIKQYRKRPVYWPIQSSKRSYGFVLFHEKIDRNTFYALQQEPYLPTKRRAVQLRLEELGKKVLTVQGAARKPIEKEMDELRQLAEELAQFAKDLEAITRGGYEPETDWIDDGVILRMAPLWSVIPLWKSEPKKYWEELAAGKYDWSRIAMKYWPERVKQACKKNKSYAIAHGHEEWYEGK